LYTGSGGINLHIGNNPLSRQFRTMASPHTSFAPEEMHRDAKYYVARIKGGDPTPGEVSDYFRHMAIEEFIREPGASLAFYANKLRWFWTPLEIPSTSSVANDLRFTPLLHLAFVPTWLVAS